MQDKKVKMRKYLRVIELILLCGYVFYILYLTLLCRTPRTFYQYNYKLFWSYQYFFDQDHPQGRQIILNILFFVPFGFLLSAVLNSFHIKSKKKIFLITIVAACLLSATIEFLQLILKLGFSEFDDVMDNTAGAAIGALIYLPISAGREKRRKNLECRKEVEK